MAPVPPDPVLAARQKFFPLLKEGIGMDLELKFGTAESVQIHKELLFMQCPIFQAITGWRRESNRETRELRFPNEHPLIIKALVRFLYDGTFIPPPPGTTESPLLFHLDLSDAAETWGLIRLKWIVDESFMGILLDGSTDFVSIMAKLHGAYKSAWFTHNLYREAGIEMSDEVVKELVDNKDFKGLREMMRADLTLPVRRLLQHERLVVHRLCFTRRSK